MFALKMSLNVQTGLSEPLQTDELLHYELDAGNGLKVKVGSVTSE